MKVCFFGCGGGLKNVKLPSKMAKKYGISVLWPEYNLAFL